MKLPKIFISTKNRYKTQFSETFKTDPDQLIHYQHDELYISFQELTCFFELIAKNPIEV